MNIINIIVKKINEIIFKRTIDMNFQYYKYVKVLNYHVVMKKLYKFT
jgi:hypothetical protein